MPELLTQVETKYRKTAIPAVQSGDTVRVHQLIREGSKQRVQVFEGVVIRTHRMNELTAVMTVRRIASGVGVEKTFLLHSPNLTKVEIVRRAKVRRNFLSYLRGRRGKSARLQEQAFDRAAANVAATAPAKAEVPQAAADDDKIDTEVTEIDAEQAEDVENQPDLERLDTETKAEDETSAEGDSPVSDADAEDDEVAQVQAEAEDGIERVEDQTDRQQ
jgi:large subunit ribosomal protein L19